MEFVMCGSGDEHEASNSCKGKKPSYHRHTVYQTQRLEEFFKECPHPDENQRSQLGKELRLTPKQVKFWFQNKRTQMKAQNERADNVALRAENERIHCENLAIMEALRNLICTSCAGPRCGEEKLQQKLQKLRQQNAQLKEEHEKVVNLLARSIGKPTSQLEPLISPLGFSLDLSPRSPLNQGMASPAINLDHSLDSAISSNSASPHQIEDITDMEKSVMSEVAANAMDELIRLLHVNEPLWIKPATDGRYVIHHESYKNIFSRSNHFKTSSARMESSKDSGLVKMNGMQLVDMFLDSDKWLDLFPTIVSKAKTLQVLRNGSTGDRTGSLQLMYEKMQILSPLVPPREFYFLRHCQRIELGLWVIVDVSYDCLKENIPHSRSWRLPSGCMIQEMPNGCSKVTWIEHVEVDDEAQTHRLYRDLVCSNVAYGAERWIYLLQRMCERVTYCGEESAPNHHPGGVISLAEGRESIMKLAHRMVKTFCGILGMSGKLDFPQSSEMNNSGVWVSVRKNKEPGLPGGLIVSAATSLWLPLSSRAVFDFLRDVKTRVQWDILSNGHPVKEIAHISFGTHQGNSISIVRKPIIPTEKSMLMIQESCRDPLGSLVVYAPIDIPAINAAIRGEDSSIIPILPSGFIISTDGRADSEAEASTSIRGSSGSLLTVAFQILVSSPSSTKQLNMESVATVNALISSTVQRIKAALNSCYVD